MDHQPARNDPSPIALQLWTIRDAMASDADEALRRVKAAGFSAVEVAPLPPGLTPGRLAECLARHGLAVVSIHGDLPTPANIGLWAAGRSASAGVRRSSGTAGRATRDSIPSPGCGT